MKRLSITVFVVTILALAGPAAAQNIFITFEDARTLAGSAVSVTPSVANVAAAFFGESGRVGTLIGGRVTFGTGAKPNVSIAVDRFQTAGGGEGTNFMSFAVKLPLSAHSAILAPVGLSFGSGQDVGDSLHVDPGVFFTAPIGKNVDFNPSVRLIVPFCEECETLVGFELGAGFRSSKDRITIRPALGILVNPGDSGAFWTIGAAVTIGAGRR